MHRTAVRVFTLAAIAAITIPMAIGCTRANSLRTGAPAGAVDGFLMGAGTETSQTDTETPVVLATVTWTKRTGDPSAEETVLLLDSTRVLVGGRDVSTKSAVEKSDLLVESLRGNGTEAVFSIESSQGAPVNFSQPKPKRFRVLRYVSVAGE